MEILIGKEPGQGRLLVSVSVNGKVKMAAMGGVGSVPRSVSRCFPAEGRAHCKIEVDSKGTMVITNLKPENVTYVDGMEIVAKKITGNSQVTLGKDKYAVDINAVVNIAKKLAGQEGSDEDNKEKKFFIQPLKKVWDTYHDEMFNLQKRQKNLGLIKSLYIPCTILSSGAGFLALRTKAWRKRNKSASGLNMITCVRILNAVISWATRSMTSCAKARIALIVNASG